MCYQMEWLDSIPISSEIMQYQRAFWITRQNKCITDYFFYIKKIYLWKS